MEVAMAEKRRGAATDYGTIKLRAEELGPCKEIVTLQFRGIHLEKKEFFGKADPFLVFHRVNEDCSFTVFHKTEVIKNTLNPAWKPFTLPVQLICNGDYNRLIHVECLDWNRDGSHDLIGEFSTDMHHLARGQGPENLYEVINPKKKSKKNYKGSGVVELVYSDVQVQHTFLEYIQGGMQMKFTVAIDFTASNGNPKNPTSLHYYSPYTLNQYSLAICAVGEIIQDYDSDRLFPAFGFGASLPDGNVSHNFPLNFNPSDPFCRGVEGLLEAYYNSLSRVELLGPTNFAPVINHVARIAAAKQDGSEYFVLLIITDGVITDMSQTIEAVVKASALPMSIIIVGVGNADFKDMDKLDGDNVRLRTGGQNVRRDIVQFVPIQQFLTPNQGATESCKAALAKEVLGEIPDQVLQYMKNNGIEPHRQPVPHNLSSTPDNSTAPPANVLGIPPPPYEP